VRGELLSELNEPVEEPLSEPVQVHKCHHLQASVSAAPPGPA